MNKTEDFNKVWKKLILKKLIVSDVLPSKWFTIDNVKQLSSYKKENIKMQDNVLVTILTYNEENNISNVLKDVCEQFKNVLVVDNNSEDLTIEKVKISSLFSKT